MRTACSPEIWRRTRNRRKAPWCRQVEARVAGRWFPGSGRPEIDGFAAADRARQIARDARPVTGDVTAVVARDEARETFGGGLGGRAVQFLSTAPGDTRLSGGALTVGRAFSRAQIRRRIAGIRITGVGRALRTGAVPVARQPSGDGIPRACSRLATRFRSHACNKLPRRRRFRPARR